MAFKRPAPKQLSQEEFSKVLGASAQQTGRTVRAKTYDPNYPVFEVPVNQKVLAYVPNHTVTEADGVITLRKDKFAAHAVRDGRSFATIRCTGGIQSETLHLDGSCPLCDASAEVWELYNLEYAEIAKSKGLNPEAPEDHEALKPVRIELLKNQVISAPEVWYTFPIVVIECTTDANGNLTTTPKKNELGQVNGKIMWYSIREKTYNDKWVKAFETAPTEDDITPTHPGGMWAVLNFTYDSKDGKHDKMGSARALAVGFKSMSAEYQAVASAFDEMTVGWTPEMAMNTLVDNALRSGEEQQEVCDQILSPVRDKIAMYKISQGGAMPQIGANPTSADSVLSAFGATPAEVPTQGATPEVAGAIPQVPTTDVPMGVQ